jgi:hypothetical protein
VNGTGLLSDCGNNSPVPKLLSLTVDRYFEGVVARVVYASKCLKVISKSQCVDRSFFIGRKGVGGHGRNMC